MMLPFIIAGLMLLTPEPTPAPTVLPPITFPIISSPTPAPTAVPAPTISFALPSDDLLGYLATVEAQLGAVPTMPAAPTEDGSEIWGYAKWLINEGAVDEMLGPFAPPVSHILVIVAILFTLALIYVIVFVAVLVIRFIVWIVTIVLKFVPFLG